MKKDLSAAVTDVTLKNYRRKKLYRGVFATLGFLVPLSLALVLISDSSSTKILSELRYVEHSPLGIEAGSIIPASCDSDDPYRDPTLAGGTPGSHFYMDCTTDCPSLVGVYDPYYDPGATGCPIPIITSFVLSPSTIPYNTSTTGSWTTTGAMNCSIDHGIGAVPTNGGGVSPALTTTTTYTLSCSNTGGTATAQATVTVLPGPDYKICPSSVTLGGPFGTTQLRAFYIASGTIDCLNTAAATNVTTLVNWSSTNNAIATVDNGGSKGLVTRVAIGSTTINVTPYLGLNALGSVVTVTCVPTVTCGSAGPVATAANTCPSQTFNINDGCGGTVICTGTRTCNFNWKEVAQ